MDADEHREIVEQFCDFMAGRADPLLKQLDRRMNDAAQELDFEKAARLRDDISALRRAMEKQTVVLGDGTDADLVGICGDDLQASVQIFHVRGGRVRGERGWIVDLDDDSSLESQVENFLLQFYGGRASDDGATAVPREILVPALPPQPAEMTQWLSSLRGSRVSLRIPQRGDKRNLAETATLNAQQALNRYRLKRASDLTSRSEALTELSEALGMDAAPLRIECIDISHVQGTNVVASLVVFEDGLAKKSDYRRFAIRDSPGDDVASIAEVVRRRFSRSGSEATDAADTVTGEVAAPVVSRPGIDPLTGRPKRFAYPPQLLVVDGGQPQVNAASAVLTDLGITDITVCGLAKRLEEVWLPGDDDPVILPRTSEALYLLQRLRDEAHRFAITFHRAKRSKSMIVSALDGIAGLGETRRKALIKHFGSLTKIKLATVDQIGEVSGIGRSTAEAIFEALATPVDVVPGAAATAIAAGNRLSPELGGATDTVSPAQTALPTRISAGEDRE